VGRWTAAKRRAVITGCLRIGRLLRNGWWRKVRLWHRDINVDAPTSSPRRSAHGHPADVTTPTAAGRGRRRRRAMGGIDILFNNAGTGNQAPLHEWTRPSGSTHRRQPDRRLSRFRAAVPHMQRQAGQHRLTASISGTRRRPVRPVLGGQGRRGRHHCVGAWIQPQIGSTPFHRDDRHASPSRC